MFRMLLQCVLVVLIGNSALADDTAKPAVVPARTESGQTLVVPEKFLDDGDVYHVIPGQGTQLIWQSDAPLLRVTATCCRVVGYFVAPFDLKEGQAPLTDGALRIPVASITTGTAGYDAELHGPMALNAAEYPEITFRMTGVSDYKLVEERDGRRTYALTVAGEWGVKDTTTSVAIPMRLTFVPMTWGTMMLGAGDLLILRGRFDVQREALGLSAGGGDNSDLSEDTAHFDLFMLACTVSPAKNFDPSVSDEQHYRQMRLLTMLRDFDDPQAGYAYGQAYAKEIWEDAAALDRLASLVLTEDGIKTRNLGFALKLAQRANELTKHGDPSQLGTLAMVHHERGDLGEALRWIRQAIEHADGASEAVQGTLQALLERYEAESAE